ncbi:MAG: hypothetical protein HYW34_03070 [Candidatus Brennerbacteria bacterium]|nr:hypothetical protein [Candidatus Brennerbacteria bacterium]
MKAEIENSELISLKKQVEEIDETLDVVFRLIENKIDKVYEVGLRKDYIAFCFGFGALFVSIAVRPRYIDVGQR